LSSGYDSIKSLLLIGALLEQPTDECSMIKKNLEVLKNNLREPLERMKPKLPSEIAMKCVKFAHEYKNRHDKFDNFRLNLVHDASWKDGISKQEKVVDNILAVIDETWNNPMYSEAEFRNKINKGTYVADIVLPLIRASLNGLQCYITTAEHQSVASQSRKNEQEKDARIGDKPDIMLAMTSNNKKFELLFVECSRILCTSREKNEDSTKLWREVNDGVSWIGKACKPAKNQFGVTGTQIYGTKMSLNVLMQDSNNLNRYFHVKEVEIPLIPCDANGIINIVDLLLTLRNIVIINHSLLRSAVKNALNHQPHMVIPSTTVKKF
ncbi:20246_t:CDS:2, partial [Racocetra persica]